MILALASCTPGAPKSQATVLVPPPAPVSTGSALAPTPARNPFAPMCKTEGCCAGHGEVAYVQPDFAIICTDGQASEICDCHT